MALIKCSECGHMISSTAPSCIYCGATIQASGSKVIVYGTTQLSHGDMIIEIYNNHNTLIGKVGKGEVFKANVEKDVDLVFKYSFHKARVHVKAGYVTKITLFWNRLTGKLIATVNVDDDNDIPVLK